MSRPLEAWLPALARFAPAHPIHRTLARADRLGQGPRGYLAGLDGYLQTGAQPLPAAALTREYVAGDAGDALWLSADPAWVEPDLTGARLLACGKMGLSEAEAQALAEPLLPLFAEYGMQLLLTRPDRWHVRLPPASEVPDFPAPEQALGDNLLQHLPQGTGGRRWRLLQNEVQVLLHQQPLGSMRRAAGSAPVNSLWFWGAGVLPAIVRSELACVMGDDLLLRALAARAGVAQRPCAPTQLAGATAGWLVDLQDRPVSEIDADWWPTLDALARHQPLRLSFASGERWQLTPWHRLRFWRRGGA